MTAAGSSGVSSSDARPLRARVALVTGGGRGIGRACVLAGGAVPRWRPWRA
jgi:hypothetical protein